MASLRSPGVVVREKDLTNGRADIANNNIAGFVAPFAKGEIGAPVLVGSEADLISEFGEPVEQNAEYWLSATNYLSYGGTLSVVRVDTDDLKNAIAREGNYVGSVTIDNPQTNGKYVTAPAVTISGGGGTGAEGVAQINSDGRVVGVTVTQTGSGYTSTPSVTIAPVGSTALASVAAGSTATATAAAGNLDAGSLTGTASITAAGSGYSSAPTVTVSGGGGTNGQATATINAAGEVTQITLSGGSGYTSAPTLVVSDPTGVVVTVTSGGTNYDPNGSYPVSVSGGTAVAPFSGTAVVDSNGIVTGINVSSFGNYTSFTGIAVTVPAPGVTASATAAIAAEAIKIPNADVYSTSYAGNSNGWLFAAKTPGSWGNSLRVCTVDNGPRQSIRLAAGSTATSSNVAVGDVVTNGTNKYGKVIDVNTVTISAVDYTVLHIVITTSNGAYVAAPTTAQLFTDADTLTVGVLTNNSIVAGSIDDGEEWYQNKELYSGSGLFWNSFAARPVATQDSVAFYGSTAARDAVHVAVVDVDGAISGAKNTVLETFFYASKANNARGPEGGSNYYKGVVSTGSTYVYSGDTVFEYQPKTDAFEPKGAGAFDLTSGTDYQSLSSGFWDINVTEINEAYDSFVDLETVNIDYLLMGPGMYSENDTRLKLAHIAAIAANRKDCMAFGSPHRGNIISDSGLTLSNREIVKNLKNFFGPIGSNSYLVFDSNYKYVYDRWNDTYRYIPCNSDVAGLVASTATTAEPWFSPAGFSRGGIRNVAKLAWNPSKIDRDELYSNRINPIAVFPGQGAVLFGDKTALSNPSAFDRINVRRLFLVLERAIEQAAKAQLFEINDETTRNVFKGVIEPFLRDVQARRGVYDFLVVCDGSNNTSAVIDNNEFVADIYIQPARSINFITLTFVATRTGISFSEVVAR
jgi:hypothetical protein